MIEVADLRKRYGDFTAVDGVSFDGPQGREVFAPARHQRGRQDHHDRDPGGATSALRAARRRCSATTPPTAGPLRARIGLVLQESGLFGDLTAPRP